MSGAQMSSAANLYQSVINDVITSVRESFLDESVDENVLLELKNLWVQVTPLNITMVNTKVSRVEAGG